ncbi:MAG: PDZ domain-containing protein [Phycisphaerales bacterium]
MKNQFAVAMLAACLCAALPGCVIVVDREYETQYEVSSSRKMIGLELGRLSDALAAQSGVVPGRACLVTRVVPGSPAQVAGVQMWDVIAGVEGQPDGSYASLRAGVSAKAPGEAIELTIKRGGAEMKLSPVVGAR